jgi:hypothetical protein
MAVLIHSLNVNQWICAIVHAYFPKIVAPEFFKQGAQRMSAGSWRSDDQNIFVLLISSFDYCQ